MPWAQSDLRTNLVNVPIRDFRDKISNTQRDSGFSREQPPEVVG